MSDTQQLPLSVQPVISYPREAQVGKTYLMTIDLQPSGDGEWLYEEEEYPIYCMLETSPLFSSKPVGEPAVVLHRFGGSYGAAKFLLTAAQEEMEGEIKVTLVNGWGVPIRVLSLDNLKVTQEEDRKQQIGEYEQSQDAKYEQFKDARNCLRINHEGDSIQLSWQRGQSNPHPAPSVTFTHPFDEQALADLRWYLEEYLRFPYGLAPDNAAKIEQKFQDWGEQLFELVFRSSEKARHFFQAATYEGLNQCELVITSDSPEVLNLPWELLYSPSDRQFLAPSLAGMSRSLSHYAVRAEMSDLPQDKLNILLVIARPYGERDVPFQGIARAMLTALQPIRRQINVKVLRPPSFEELERELNVNKGFYHIVHFDGHGGFDPDSIGFQHSSGSAGQGVLVFEKADGSPEIVTAVQISQSLVDWYDVPVFVLNASKFAYEGREFSSVATRLISLGVKGVVAMANSFTVEATRRFVERLYEALARGASLSQAVSAARRRVLNQPLRLSPKGSLPLQDWFVPVLYQQETYTPFTPSVVRQHDDDLEPATTLLDLPEENAYGFIGRDYDILRLESAFRQNHVVLLKGMGGVGKTELACGFARWLDDTQGRTGGIFFTSFERGAGLSNVVHQIGRAWGGDRFSQLMAEQQRAVVLQYLKNNPCLLIWDNFEPVSGFPAGNEPLLSAEERDNLKRFLKELRGGQSWVLITSRREELWLDCSYTLLNLQGLSQQDTEVLASRILKAVAVNRASLPVEYLELLKLLGGHPLSLRVVLPHLRNHTPVQLVEALRLGLDTFQATEGEGRDKSLKVSLDYSFAALSEHTRNHLPFLALFSERVNSTWLHIFSENPDNEFGKIYQAFFGENLQESGWQRILNEAAEGNLLEYLSETEQFFSDSIVRESKLFNLSEESASSINPPKSHIYKIHPVIPWYLRQRLIQQHSITAIADLEKQLINFYGNLADNWRKSLVSNAELASLVLRWEEPNLLQNLRLAEQQQDWSNAQAILQALGEMYQRVGRKAEFRALRQRILNQIGFRVEQVKTKGKSIFNFWIDLRIIDADEAIETNDLEGASAIIQEILDELTVLSEPAMNDKVAAIYEQLGRVLQQRRRFDEAMAYYQTSLQIRQDIGDVCNTASDYHQLGTLALEQQRFDEAMAYYQTSLQIRQDIGDVYNTASDYHQLGTLALEQQRFDEAMAYYQRSLQIRQDIGNVYNTASDYHQLGTVAFEQQRFDEAMAYYQKALEIYIEFKDEIKIEMIQQNLEGIVEKYPNRRRLTID